MNIKLISCLLLIILRIIFSPANGFAQVSDIKIRCDKTLATFLEIDAQGTFLTSLNDYNLADYYEDKAVVGGDLVEGINSYKSIFVDQDGDNHIFKVIFHDVKEWTGGIPSKSLGDKEVLFKLTAQNGICKITSPEYSPHVYKDELQKHVLSLNNKYTHTETLEQLKRFISRPEKFKLASRQVLEIFIIMDGLGKFTSLAGVAEYTKLTGDNILPDNKNSTLIDDYNIKHKGRNNEVVTYQVDYSVSGEKKIETAEYSLKWNNFTWQIMNPKEKIFLFKN